MPCRRRGSGGDRGAVDGSPGRGSACGGDRDAVRPVGLRRGGAGSRRREMRLRQLSFVPLAPDRALAVLVGVDGSVENRVVPLPPEPAPSRCRGRQFRQRAAAGLTLTEAEARLRAEIARAARAIDARRRRTGRRGPRRLERGPCPAPGADRSRSGQPDRRGAAADLERVRRLLDELEDRQEIARLLEGAREGQGCRIFIGSENRMFALSGSSVIAAPYRGSEGRWSALSGLSDRRD